jgi:CheY-like chemotaxis protein
LIAWTNTALVDARGQVEFVVGTGLDVTDHRHLEQQLLRAQKMEAIGQLAGGIAHDFNNIVTGIAMYADALRDRLGTDDMAREMGEEIRRAAGRARDLTRQLLLFSRAPISDARIINLNGLVNDLRKMLRTLIGETVVLTTELAPDLGNVRADPGQIQQVIMNLALNARDAMPSGGRLTIETSNAESGVLLAVRDSGVGMTPEVQERIFDPFFTTKEPGRGTGLGLSTAYRIVQQAGGSIDVESRPGAGSTFRICLPRVAALPDAPSTSPPAKISLKGRTVLLVEDEDIVRRSVTYALSDLGCRVHATGNPEEALGWTEPADLLITDMVMPKIKGGVLAARIRERRPGIAVLYISGYTEDDRRLEPGSVFLQKPFTPQELLARINEALTRRPPERVRDRGPAQ